jgi:hypothetical protein
MPNGSNSRTRIRDVRFVTIWYYNDGHLKFLWHSYKITRRGKLWGKKDYMRRLRIRKLQIIRHVAAADPEN